MQNKEINVSVDPLKGLYYERIDQLEREEDIIQRDITHEFYTFLEDKLDNKELINIAIKGEVSGSKSTSAIAIIYEINSLIEKRDNKKIDMFKSIFSDQTEFLRFINTEETNLGIVIDEFSDLANTGMNATTESALFNYYSNVFAQKFIHRVSCSPSVILDINSNIILEYVGKNEKEKVSKFILRYKNVTRGFQEWTLGCIYIDVSKILDTNFYKRYRKKKFQRMELLDKHGVRDLRELEFADSILDVVDELKDFVADGNKQELSDMIQATISKVNREKKRIYSMIVSGEIGSRCRNILNLYSSIGNISIRSDKTKSEMEKLKLYTKMKKVQKILRNELEEERKRRVIYKDYLQIK
jgi:hypothetical protein